MISLHCKASSFGTGKTLLQTSCTESCCPSEHECQAGKLGTPMQTWAGSSNEQPFTMERILAVVIFLTALKLGVGLSESREDVFVGYTEKGRSNDKTGTPRSCFSPGNLALARG